MSEAIRSTDEPESETAEGRTAGAAGSGTREAVAELGDRARAVVEELARHARERREAAAARAAEPSSVPPSPERTADEAMAVLPQRLSEIRAHMGEVADVLEATIERLETVEHQLGDPDENVERQLAQGIARCERVLMGIEYRVESKAREGYGFREPDRRPGSSFRDTHPRPGYSDLPENAARKVAPPRPPGPLVLVMSSSSRRRGDLCVAIEYQGLAAVAAHDLASALRAFARSAPAVALLDLEGIPGERVAALEQWKDYEERGALPRAAVIGIGDSEGLRHGFEIIREEHGAAAMAAVLVALATGERSGERSEPGDPRTTERGETRP
jgi:hypothetical protein